MKFGSCTAYVTCILATRCHRAGKLDDQTACSDTGHLLCTDLEDGPFNMRVVRNNLLSPDWPGGGDGNSKWLRHLGEWNTSVLVLNRGAVFRESEG